jgi:hypothetical protein
MRARMHQSVELRFCAAIIENLPRRLTVAAGRVNETAGVLPLGPQWRCA